MLPVRSDTHHFVKTTSTPEHSIKIRALGTNKACCSECTRPLRDFSEKSFLNNPEGRRTNQKDDSNK